jgi:hypothetical protein
MYSKEVKGKINTYIGAWPTHRICTCLVCQEAYNIISKTEQKSQHLVAYNAYNCRLVRFNENRSSDSNVNREIIHTHVIGWC